MNAIMGMTVLAQNTDDPAKRQNYLMEVGGASKNLLQLIDGVLDVSDIEEGNFSFVPAEFHFAAMLKSVFDEVASVFLRKSQAFTANIDPSIPEVLISDERRLAQVIANLLSNASKFTGDNGSIQCKAFVLSMANDMLTIQVEVADNGIGISKEQQERLFVAFEQVDGGVSRKFGGAGLGLYISKNIVEMMGGEIWVESALGRGSKFVFTFRAKIKAPDTRTDPPASFFGKTALLVEDVEINREIVMTMLEGTGLHIVCAADGREAVELFSADPEKYNVIFMDINMPEMDGVEATRRIRALGTPEGAGVPILAMTANILPDEVKSYFAAGMTDHIGKPIDFDKLLRMICLHMR
jgi:CheY-like chemotaxis protein